MRMTIVESATGFLPTVMNVIWILFGGIWIEHIAHHHQGLFAAVPYSKAGKPRSLA